jgi:hypothetical protein
MAFPLASVLALLLLLEVLPCCESAGFLEGPLDSSSDRAPLLPKGRHRPSSYRARSGRESMVGYYDATRGEEVRGLKLRLRECPEFDGVRGLQRLDPFRKSGAGFPACLGFEGKHSKRICPKHLMH